MAQKTQLTDLEISVSLSTAKTAILSLMEAEQTFSVRQTPIMLGAPGQGKSSIMEQLVDDLNQQVDKRIARLIEEGISLEEAKAAHPSWLLRSFRLSQCDPTDLKGVPVYLKVDDREICSFAPPDFPLKGMPNSAGGQNMVIFLDELPQSTPTMMNLAANIIDGKVGDYELDPARTFIVAAGNRKQDKAATYDIPRNVGNRMIVLNVRTTFAEWEEWAMKNNLSATVVGYLKEHQIAFNEAPPDHGYTYATPRSWHKVSCQMKHMGDQWYNDNSHSLPVLTGTVGQATAHAFFQFAKVANQKFNIEKIFSGQMLEIDPTTQKDILYSLVLEAAARINNWVGEVATKPSIVKVGGKAQAEALVKELGKDKVKSISNVYKWLNTTKGIDTAFSALINKYQNPVTRGLLRFAMTSQPEFKEAAESYTKIHTIMSS